VLDDPSHRLRLCSLEPLPVQSRALGLLFLHLGLSEGWGFGVQGSRRL
jgi:hypothetical protein